MGNQGGSTRVQSESQAGSVHMSVPDLPHLWCRTRLYVCHDGATLQCQFFPQEVKDLQLKVICWGLPKTEEFLATARTVCM